MTNVFSIYLANIVMKAWPEELFSLHLHCGEHKGRVIQAEGQEKEFFADRKKR
jgi:hypothetical protein